MTRKKIIGSLTAVICVSMLLGGTLAWSDFTQSKTNKFRGMTDPDVTLHDDFDGKLNKDVYVENSGNTDIFVRLRLDEYMEVGGESFDPQANVKDKTTWAPHTYNGSEDCGKIDSEFSFHRYYKWQLSGNGKGYTPGTPGLVSSQVDGEGNVITEGPKSTADKAKPVEMEKYIQLSGMDLADMTQTEKTLWNAIESGCWITDIDGWAYWSNPLEPDSATNMLLDEVKLIKEPSDDWFYGIDVKLQAVTANDFSGWNSNGYTTSDRADKLISERFNQ